MENPFCLLKNTFCDFGMKTSAPPWKCKRSELPKVGMFFSFLWANPSCCTLSLYVWTCPSYLYGRVFPCSTNDSLTRCKTQLSISYWWITSQQPDMSIHSILKPQCGCLLLLENELQPHFGSSALRTNLSTCCCELNKDAVQVGCILGHNFRTHLSVIDKRAQTDMRVLNFFPLLIMIITLYIQAGCIMRLWCITAARLGRLQEVKTVKQKQKNPVWSPFAVGGPTRTLDKIYFSAGQRAQTSSQSHPGWILSNYVAVELWTSDSLWLGPQFNLP